MLFKVSSNMKNEYNDYNFPSAFIMYVLRLFLYLRISCNTFQGERKKDKVLNLSEWKRAPYKIAYIKIWVCHGVERENEWRKKKRHDDDDVRTAIFFFHPFSPNELFLLNSSVFRIRHYFAILQHTSSSFAL